MGVAKAKRLQHSRRRVAAIRPHSADKVAFLGESSGRWRAGVPIINIMNDNPMTEARARPFGLAASLHDAVALAEAWPGVRMAFAGDGADCDIFAPASLVMPVSLPAGRPHYFFAFGNAGAAGVAAISAPMIDALTEAAGTGFMAVCLAAPWRGRTVYQGHLFEDGGLKGNLVREFSLVLQGGVGLVPREVVAAGAAGVKKRCAALKEQGRALALIDAINDDDCAVVAAACAGLPLVGGGAWLAASGDAAVAEQPDGPLAILSGALDRQTVFQLGAARLAMPVFDLDFSEPRAAAEALTWAAQNMNEPFVIASTASPDRVTPGAPAATVLGEVAKELVAAGVRRLMITGDETARAVIAAVGIQNVTVGAPFGPLTWLHLKDIALCIKPSGAGTKNLFLSEFGPQIRLNATAE